MLDRLRENGPDVSQTVTNRITYALWIPPLLALFGIGAALGLLAIAAGIGALAFGGLQREAERMAATSSELEDSGEAMEQIFENFGGQPPETTAPRGRQSRGPTVEQHHHWDGADFSGGSTAETKRQVKEAVTEADREERAREDGRAG